MSARKTTAAALALTAWIAGQGAAHAASAGGESFDFLTLDVGARPAAMGGAHAAVANGAAALHYNPAGLARTPRHEASFMHNQYVEGVSQEYMAAALQQGFGVSLQYLSSGRQQRTTISKPDGAGLGTYGLSDMALSLGYGRAVGPLDLGAAAKYVRESIDNVSASGAMIDLGARYETEAVPGLSFGAALSNLGPPVRHQGAREAVPALGRLGAAYQRRFSKHRILLAADLVKQRTDRPRFGLGVEALWAESVALRLGYNGFQDSGPGVSAGGGYTLKDISIDYAFAPYGALGFGHRISLTWRWGGSDSGRTDRPAVTRPVSISGSSDALMAGAESNLDDAKPALAQKKLEVLAARIDAEPSLRVRFLAARGRAYFLTENYRPAKEQFAEALRVAVERKDRGPAAAQAYYGLGLCLEQDGNLPYALKFMRKALELDITPKHRREIENHIREVEILALSR